LKVELIEKKFPDNLIKTRRGSFGKELIYVETPEYIRRLNEIFSYNWTWVIQNVIREGDCVTVQGCLRAWSMEKMAFGGAIVKRNKKTGEIINYADDLKSAASDALKKACSLYGIGLHLWDEIDDEVPRVEEKTDINKLNHEDRVSRTIDAFVKYNIGRDELEKSVNKPDISWTEKEFLFFREQIKKAIKSKGNYQLEVMRDE